MATESENRNAYRRSVRKDSRRVLRRRYGADVLGLSSLPIASSIKRSRSAAANGTGVSTVIAVAASLQ
jgi:hypothetical protein